MHMIRCIIYIYKEKTYHIIIMIFIAAISLSYHIWSVLYMYISMSIYVIISSPSLWLSLNITYITSYHMYTPIIYVYMHVYLVGDFNPFEKFDRQIGFIFPKFSGWTKIKKNLELPPPRYHYIFYITPHVYTHNIYIYKYIIYIPCHYGMSLSSTLPDLHIVRYFSLSAPHESHRRNGLAPCRTLPWHVPRGFHGEP